MAARILNIIIWKNLDGQGTRGEWSNSHQIITDLPTDDPNVMEIARRIGVAEARFHLSNVIFSRAAISTYYSEQKHGQLNDHAEMPLNFVGLIAETVDADGNKRSLPGEVVIRVKRKAGKSVGTLQYRHAIAHNEWSGTGGGVGITQAKLDQVSQAFRELLEHGQDLPKIAHATKGSEDGAPGVLVSSYTPVGTGNRQLDARRKPKKSSSAITGTTIMKAAQAQTTGVTGIFQNILNLKKEVLGAYENYGPGLSEVYQLVLRATQAYNEFRRQVGQQAIPLPPAPEVPALPPIQ